MKGPVYTPEGSPLSKIETWQRALAANSIVDSLTLPDAMETTTLGCWRTLPRIHRKQIELPPGRASRQVRECLNWRKQEEMLFVKGKQCDQTPHEFASVFYHIRAES